LLVGATAIEVIAAEVLIHRPVGGKDGGVDGHDRLLGAASSFDAVELGALTVRRPMLIHPLRL
jgi:hypothetical protein